MESIQATGALLDGEDFAGWLALFDEQSEYEITAHSSEIQQEMLWWKSDRPSLQKTLKEIPKHVHDKARRLHIVTPTQVDLSGDHARATSTFAVFRITPDGDTSVYVVGHYQDTLVKKEERWLYKTHKVILQTRMLAVPTHVPI